MHINLKCSVCGGDHDKTDVDEHGFKLVSKPGEPLALMIPIPESKPSIAPARLLALVFAEIRKQYPDKRIQIQPTHLTIDTELPYGGQLSKVRVTAYAGFEA